jgi:hypothetical protein
VKTRRARGAQRVVPVHTAAADVVLMMLHALPSPDDDGVSRSERRQISLRQ